RIARSGSGSSLACGARANGSEALGQASLLGPVHICHGGRAWPKWLADQGAATPQYRVSCKEPQRRNAGHLGQALRVGLYGRAGGVALIVKGMAIACFARLAGTAIQTHAIRQRNCEQALAPRSPCGGTRCADRRRSFAW